MAVGASVAVGVSVCVGRRVRVEVGDAVGAAREAVGPTVAGGGDVDVGALVVSVTAICDGATELQAVSTSAISRMPVRRVRITLVFPT